VCGTRQDRFEACLLENVVWLIARESRGEEFEWRKSSRDPILLVRSARKPKWDFTIFLTGLYCRNLLQFYTEIARLGAKSNWKTSPSQQSGICTKIVAGHQAPGKNFPRACLFYPGPNIKELCFQCVVFGLTRAITKTEGGRRAEDPFRGLRAGPARSSPRLLPPPTPKPHPMDLPIGGSMCKPRSNPPEKYF
jgi:hypothetical protein